MVSLAEVLGLGETLARRVEARIKEWWLKHGRPHVWVGFSGGKDSSTVLAAAVASGVTFSAVFWHIPGQTHGDNAAAARAVARALGLEWRGIRVRTPRELGSLEAEPGIVYHVVVGGRPYWEMLRVKGPPSPPPRPRWCCKYYKEEPLQHLPPARPGHRFILTGAKRADSPARARRWQECERDFRAKHGVVDHALAPLCDLRDPDVWILLRHYGIHDIVGRQYEVWGRSPNCVLCPLAGKAQLEAAVRRLPTPFLERYYRALERWDTSLAKRMKRVLEAELARRGKTGELPRSPYKGDNEGVL